MVFCTTKRDVQRLADDLMDRGFKVTSLHGDLSQVVREKSLAKFKAGKAQAIVCTDVAARGIDVDNVTHVINYDCPDDEKTYVHRIGRTGRARRTGIAVTFVDWADLPRWKMINKALDLSFPNPLEAYSTTPQLLEELALPADATGRVPLQPTPTNEDTRPGQTETSKRHDGRRRRRSNGVVVREKTEESPQNPDSKPDGAANNNNRRRRRPKKVTT
jgi:superfamily II DNA/RNA helicase